MDRDARPKPIREAEELLYSFYGFDRVGAPHRYLLDKNFRDDAIRLIIFNFHLATQELLKSTLYRRLPKTRTFTATQTKKYIWEMRARDAIDWAARLRAISKDLHAALADLNRLRNNAGHNWTLDTYTVRKQTRGRGTKRSYRLEWRGKRLTTTVMRDEFIPFYEDVYLAVWKAYFRVGGRFRPGPWAAGDD